MTLWSFEKEQLHYIEGSEKPPDLYSPGLTVPYIDFDSSFQEAERLKAMGLELGRLVAPATLVWELTAKCHLRCVFCSGSFPQDSAAELSTEEKRALAEELVAAKIWGINLSGGEPLLCPDLPWLLDYFTANEVPVNVMTSGWGLTPELAKQLAGHASVAATLSLDAPEPALNDELRGRHGAFDATLSSLRLLRDAGAKVLTLECVVSQRNLGYIEQMMDFCRAEGIRQLRFQPVVLVGRVGEMEGLELSEAQLGQLSHRVQQMRERLYQDAGPGGVPPLQVNLIDQSTHVVRGLETGFNWGGIIGADGTIKVSVYLSYDFGNLREAGGFMPLWRRGFSVAWRHPDLQKLKGQVRGVKDLERIANQMAYTMKHLDAAEAQNGH